MELLGAVIGIAIGAVVREIKRLKASRHNAWRRRNSHNPTIYQRSNKIIVSVA
jgi:hypothetical protein